MALIIPGKTRCAICDRLIELGDDVVAFGPNGATEPDPLALFSDAGFHAACFEEHPHAERADALWRELQAGRMPE